MEAEDAMPYPMTESYYVPPQVAIPSQEEGVYEVDEEGYSFSSHYDSDAIYYEFEEDSWTYDGPDDAASEYDAIMANYMEARSKVNQMRMSRGYYPVVAMIPENSQGEEQQRQAEGTTES